MSCWRNSRRFRGLCGWLAMVALVVQAGVSAFSGPALAADPADGPYQDFPFGTIVICTADGAVPVGEPDPVPAASRDTCDTCINGCCGGPSSSRLGLSSVSNHAPTRYAAGSELQAHHVGEPVIVAVFSSRAPPHS